MTHGGTVRRGMNLVEVLVATVILALAILPTIDLVTTSSSEVVKVQQRLLALSLGSAVIEEMRSRPLPARADVPDTAVKDLPMFLPLLAEHRARLPESAPRIDQTLSGFRVSARLQGTPPRLEVLVKVTWTEGGQGKSLELTGRLQSP